MRTSTILATLSLTALALTKPILETRQPATCAFYCLLTVSTQQIGEPSTLKQIWQDAPGCGTCPGHNCTGKASATETELDGHTQLVENYSYCEPLI